jgi:hypothetical protein
MSAGLKGGKFIFLRGLLARDERAFASRSPAEAIDWRSCDVSNGSTTDPHALSSTTVPGSS